MKGFSKEDIEYHQIGLGSLVPMVNVKVRKGIDSVPLPMVQCRVKGPGETKFRDIKTDPDFTQEWLEEWSEENQDAINSMFEVCCESGWEDITEKARELYGPRVKVYSEGRSGGWAYIDGIGYDTREWDGIDLNRWAIFAKYARLQADDIPRAVVQGIYDTFFEGR